MKKKDLIILQYEILLGFKKSEDYNDVIQINNKEFVNVVKQFASNCSEEVKENIVNILKIIIDTVEQEVGDKYSIDDVSKRLLEVAKMTDPNNHISPFVINDINKN